VNPGLSAAVGFAVAAVTVLLTTPLAIKVAQRTGFYDHPREYRQHKAPTPFLGGTVVLLGFSLAAVIIGGLTEPWLVVLGGAVIMWVIGTVDDRVAVAPKWRLITTGVMAVAVYRSGLGWDTAAGGLIDLLLTILWFVGLVNAFNLMDNLDGACGTVAAVAAAGIGALAAIKGLPMVSALSFALCGACVGFLPWNLAGPAKIFLGDGGSMPIGFLIAALAVATTRHSDTGSAGVLVGALLTGLPILDVTLVSVSRTRRGVSVMTGGRDHLSHRILLVTRSPRLVALTLAALQAILCSLAILGYELGTGAVAGLAFGAFAVGILAILLLDTATWRPAGIATAAEPGGAEPAPIAVERTHSSVIDPG
jgi:UDP-GlcNAc:undecaprenyl-phosphate/decaprenyl-phosphate GlcNAc-1-phosphate transferase